MVTIETLRQYVAERLRPLESRLRGLVVRGTVKVLAGDHASDATKQSGLQRAQVACTADELSDDVEAITSPGFTSRPAEAEALVFAVGGNPSHRVALLFDRTTRLKTLAVGEAALCVGRAGQLVLLLADGGVEVRATGDGAGTASSVLLKADGDVVITPGTAGDLLLGSATATKSAALAEDVQARLDALAAAINAWVPVPMDGGAALKAALVAWIAGSNAVGADNVKVKG